MLSSPGIGSGLDISGLVSQLVAAEGAPVQFRLDRDEADVQGRISAYGLIKSALSDFLATLEPLNDLASFQGRSIRTENEDVFTASADSNSVRGTYAVQVESLASAQKLRSNPYAAIDTAVGTGTLTISTGTNAFAIVVSEENNTLADIRDAINESNNNSGVLATVVSSVDGQHLILTSSEAGAANNLVVKSSGGDGGLTDLVYDPGQGVTNLTEVTAAADAQLIIDGLVVESTSNTVSNAIEGVTIDLLSSEPGVPYELTVGLDRNAAEEQVRTFVDGYNALIEIVSGLTSFDAESLIGGPLLGDSTTRGIISQLRSNIGGFVESGSIFISLAEIGISTELDGSLKIDEERLGDAFDENFDEIGKLFSNDGGYAVVLKDLIDAFLDTDGQIETRLSGLATDVEDIGDQREALFRRLEAVESRLFIQFNALDALIAELNSTSTFLSQQLTNLPGFITNTGS